MSIPEREKQARLILSQHMVDMLRPGTEHDLRLVPNERLVAYAIAIGVYTGQPFGITKLHDLTGLAKNTVRGIIGRWMAKGWVERRGDLTYVFSLEFEVCADEWFNLQFKYQTILRSADALRAVI